MTQRVRLSERYPFGLVHIIADWTENGWEFSDQDGYELQWFSRPSTPQLVSKAVRLSERGLVIVK